MALLTKRLESPTDGHRPPLVEATTVPALGSNGGWCHHRGTATPGSSGDYKGNCTSAHWKKLTLPLREASTSMSLHYGLVDLKMDREVLYA